MLSIISVLCFAAVLLLLVLCVQVRLPGVLRPDGGVQNRQRVLKHLTVIGVALGVLARLAFLGSVPEGLSSVEALTGANASVLLNTGRDLAGRSWPTGVLVIGDQAVGPLLSYITALFFRILGISLFSLRLSMALLSAGAIAAFYLLVRKLADKKTACMGTLLFAFAPFQVMSARWAVSELSYAYMLLFALAFSVYARRWPCYIGAMAFFALTLYAQPLGVIVAGLCAGALFLVQVVRFGLKKPLLYVGAVVFIGLGMPVFSSLTLPAIVAPDYDSLLELLLNVLRQTLWQAPSHENIDSAHFAMGASMSAYPMTTLLAIFGGAYALHRLIVRARRWDDTAAACVVLFCALLGCFGVQYLAPTVDALSTCALQVFVLMAAAVGAGAIGQRVRGGTGVLCVLLLLSFGEFGWTYFAGTQTSEDANCFFPGFMESAACVREAEKSGAFAQIYVDANIYPHAQPVEALEEMVILAFDEGQRYGTDIAGFRQRYVPVYDVGALTLDASAPAAYMLRVDNLDTLEISGYHYREFGLYAVLIPEGE